MGDTRKNPGGLTGDDRAYIPSKREWRQLTNQLRNLHVNGHRVKLNANSARVNIPLPKQAEPNHPFRASYDGTNVTVGLDRDTREDTITILAPSRADSSETQRNDRLTFTSSESVAATAGQWVYYALLPATGSTKWTEFIGAFDDPPEVGDPFYAESYFYIVVGQVDDDGIWRQHLHDNPVLTIPGTTMPFEGYHMPVDHVYIAPGTVHTPTGSTLIDSKPGPLAPAFDRFAGGTPQNTDIWIEIEIERPASTVEYNVNSELQSGALGSYPGYWDYDAANDRVTMAIKIGSIVASEWQQDHVGDVHIVDVADMLRLQPGYDDTKKQRLIHDSGSVKWETI